MRDSQRTKVYHAEDALTGRWTNTLGSNADAQKWVDDLLATRWFRQRFRLGKITVGVGRNLNGRSYGWGFITVSPAGRNPVVLLHEITHQILGRERGLGDYASHGPEFCAIYLFLVGHVLGDEAARALKAAYVRRGVKHVVPAGVVPRQPRYEVKTAQQAREEKKAAEAVPPTTREIAAAASVLRRLVGQGEFGPVGRKPRTHALEVARTLEQHAPALVAATRR